MLNNLKKYLIGFIIGISLGGPVLYAASTGSIGALFIKVGLDWKLMGDEIEYNTVDSSEIEDNSLLSIDILDDTIEGIDIKDGSIVSLDLQESYLTSTGIAVDSDKLDGLDSTDLYTEVSNVQLTATGIITNTLIVDNIVLGGSSFTGVSEAAPTCTDTTWWPSTAEYCTGTAYTQTSDCGNTQAAIGTASCSLPSNISKTTTKNLSTKGYWGEGNGCVDVDITCGPIGQSCNISWNKIGNDFTFSNLGTVKIVKGDTVVSGSVAGTLGNHTCTVKWDSVDNQIKVYGKEQRTGIYWTYQKQGAGIVNAVAWYILD
ncbi:hypothetical protein A9Q91_02365 [Candidatus Gracilibacteria bacterium 28_42_T64]|nr:hypothetical protein A9Q91_02365 [Candidatus Gracilibacteria bacterium 28_42_T64]